MADGGGTAPYFLPNKPCWTWSGSQNDLMFPLSIAEIITATRGTLLTSHPSSLPIKGISTDTRTIRCGELFIALVGDNFDGHDFINEAVRRDASGIIISQKGLRLNKTLSRIPVLRVPDTLKALGNLARYYRRKISVPVIAVTGSNGKTTVKEMIDHILRRDRPGIKSLKSYNNFIGVPLTLLTIGPDHGYAVLELGTNHRGEISYLARVVRPNIGVITNISETHLEGLGSIQAVAQEKKSLFKFLQPPGTAVFNPHNKWLKEIAQSTEYKIENQVTFGTMTSAQCRGTKLAVTPQGIEFAVNERYRCRLSVLGSWNMENALAAIAVTRTMGLTIPDIIERLKDFQLSPMRMEQETVKDVVLINDAYNANPRSVNLVISELDKMQVKGRKIFVLGDMLELGKYSKPLHQAVAEPIVRSTIDILVAVGKETRATAEELAVLKARQTVFHFDTAEQAGDYLSDYLRPGDLILLKGSRRIGLEKVIARVRQELAS